MVGQPTGLTAQLTRLVQIYGHINNVQQKESLTLGDQNNEVAANFDFTAEIWLQK